MRMNLSGSAMAAGAQRGREFHPIGGFAGNRRVPHPGEHGQPRVHLQSRHHVLLPRGQLHYIYLQLRSSQPGE